MPISSLVLLASVSIAAVDVSGTSTCPSPPDVSARLATVPPSVLDPALKLSALLTPDEGGVRVELHSEDGAVIAQKLLVGAGQCEDLASAATAMLLTWARDYQANAAAPPPPPPAPETDLPGHAESKQALAEKPKSLLALDVEAGLSASIADGGPALGGLIGLSLTPISAHVGGDLSIWALGSRPAPGATGTWERFALCVGPHYRFDFGTLALDLDGDLFAALLSSVPDVQGAPVLSFDPGLSAGVRVLGHAGFWADARAVTWPMSHTFPGGDALPRVEGLIAAGVSWSYP